MASSLLSDAELVAACLTGDMSSWDTLILRYSGFVYALILRTGLANADADDVFQNVCVRLYQNLDQLRHTDRLTNWLAVTIRHEIWTVHRRHRPTSVLSELSEHIWETDDIQKIAGEAPPDPEEALLALETQHLVRQCLDHLPEDCRKLLTLLYCEDPPCSYADVTQRLGMPPGSIGPKRARCLRRLEKLLQKFGY
jgi:RNA polymerase sigma factor (sigma-70 family)